MHIGFRVRVWYVIGRENKKIGRNQHFCNWFYFIVSLILQRKTPTCYNTGEAFACFHRACTKYWKCTREGTLYRSSSSLTIWVNAVFSNTAINTPLVIALVWMCSKSLSEWCEEEDLHSSLFVVFPLMDTCRWFCHKLHVWSVSTDIPVFSWTMSAYSLTLIAVYFCCTLPGNGIGFTERRKSYKPTGVYDL